MSPPGRPWHLSNVTGRGIFRATGQSTRARDPGVVIKRILSSSNRGSLAGFKKRYNRMDATGLTAAKDWSRAQTHVGLWSSQKLRRVDWGLAVTLLKSS